MTTMRVSLLLIAALFVACDAAPRCFGGSVPRKIPFEPAKHATSNRRMTHEHVEAAAKSTILPSSSSVGLVNIPRGGAQKSIAIKTEGGNALVASILDVVGRVSPTLAGLLRMLFRIVESLTGLDLVPVKVVEKPKKSKAKKSSGGGRKKRAAVVNDETSDDDEEVESAKAPPKKAAPAKKKKAAGGGGSATASKHLSTNLKSTSPNYRIQRELKQFLSEPPPNLKVSVGKNIRVWIVTFNMPEDTIYAGEKYRLRIQFPKDYPTQPPSVYFMKPTPRHEHVYTNGDICLSLLGKDWRPTMTAQSLAVSIMSILSGARKKSLPMDNARQAMNKPGQKQDDWIYHDDNC